MVHALVHVDSLRNLFHYLELTIRLMLQYIYMYSTSSMLSQTSVAELSQIDTIIVSTAIHVSRDTLSIGKFHNCEQVVKNVLG